MTHLKDRAIQRDLGKLKQWVQENLTWFNRTKCCNPRDQVRLGMKRSRAALRRRALGAGG